jgi:predicted nucleotidyltransferase
MHRSSSNSAGAIYLDKEARLSDLRAAARRAQSSDPSIVRIILFGSFAAGIPTPRSHADILVVVHDGAKDGESAGRAQVPEILAAMSPLPCPLDLVVVTEGQLERARRQGAPLVREALGHGIDLLESTR